MARTEEVVSVGAGPVRRPPPGGAPALAEDDVFVQQVRACLERRVRGESQGYVNLMQQLRQCADPVVLARFFGALGHCVGLLAAQRTAFADLFAFVFSFDWAADDAFASSFSTLINSLVSANNYFVTPAFQMLVRAFAKDFDPALKAADEARGEAALPPLPAKPVNTTWVHNTIKMCLHLVPGAAPVLFRALAEGFPHKRFAACVQEAYLRNLLCTLRYAPMLRDRLVPFLVERLIEVDVDIQVDDTAHADAARDVAEAVATAQAGAQDAGQDAERAAAVEAAEAATSAAATALTGDSAPADKLDLMMGQMFEYLAAQWRAGDRGGQRATFDALMRAFHATILHTHRAKYTQFLLFAACAANAQFTDAFVGRLVNQVTGAEACQPLTRRYAAAYLASFLARAAFVPDSTLRSSLYYLLHWVHAYLDDVAHAASAAIHAAPSPAAGAASAHAPLSGRALARLLYGGARGYSALAPRVGDAVPPPGSAAHVTFYAAAQCVLYILCFRADSLCSADGGRDFLMQWRWKRLLNSCLDPLRHCVPSVAEEFVRTAASLELASPRALDPHVQRWLHRRHHAGAERATSSEGGPPDASASTAADTSVSASASAAPFFPFDPYLLSRSSRHLQGLYLHWTAGVDDDDDDDDEEEEGGEVDEEEGEGADHRHAYHNPGHGGYDADATSLKNGQEGEGEEEDDEESALGAGPSASGEVAPSSRDAVRGGSSAPAGVPAASSQGSAATATSAHRTAHVVIRRRRHPGGAHAAAHGSLAEGSDGRAPPGASLVPSSNASLTDPAPLGGGTRPGFFTARPHRTRQRSDSLARESARLEQHRARAAQRGGAARTSSLGSSPSERGSSPLEHGPGVVEEPSIGSSSLMGLGVPTSWAAMATTADLDLDADQAEEPLQRPPPRHVGTRRRTRSSQARRGGRGKRPGGVSPSLPPAPHSGGVGPAHGGGDDGGGSDSDDSGAVERVGRLYGPNAGPPRDETGSLSGSESVGFISDDEDLVAYSDLVNAAATPSASRSRADSLSAHTSGGDGAAPHTARSNAVPIPGARSNAVPIPGARAARVQRSDAADQLVGSFASNGFSVSSRDS